MTPPHGDDVPTVIGKKLEEVVDFGGIDLQRRRAHRDDMSLAA
jgi:hypothetical protein